MPSIILTIFILHLIIKIINAVGSNTINELLWQTYIRLPTNTARRAAKLVSTRYELIDLKQELKATSAQDEFSKWAKLRRQHNKVDLEYNALLTSFKSSRTKFDSSVTILRFCLTSGLLLVVQAWNFRTPVFWTPVSWALPWWVEWLFSFPRAPRGCVGVNFWSIACKSVIALVAEAIGATVAFVKSNNTKQTRPRTNVYFTETTE